MSDQEAKHGHSSRIRRHFISETLASPDTGCAALQTRRAVGFGIAMAPLDG